MPEKKLNKNAEDKVMSPEQAIVNSAITQASAAMNMAECMNDIADNMDIMRTLMVKKALSDGILTPDEADDLNADGDENDEPAS